MKQNTRQWVIGYRHTLYLYDTIIIPNTDCIHCRGRRLWTGFDKQIDDCKYFLIL